MQTSCAHGGRGASRFAQPPKLRVALCRLWRNRNVLRSSIQILRPTGNANHDEDCKDRHKDRDGLKWPHSSSPPGNCLPTKCNPTLSPPQTVDRTSIKV